MTPLRSFHRGGAAIFLEEEENSESTCNRGDRYLRAGSMGLWGRSAGYTGRLA